MPTPMERTPFLELNKISFSAPKRAKTCDLAANTYTNKLNASSPLAVRGNSTNTIPSPSDHEKDSFFREISKEKDMRPVVLSVTEPYNSEFTKTNDHLPQLHPTIYNPANLKKSYTELIKMANDFTPDPITEDKVERLAKMTVQKSKSKQWFHYRARRITASRFRQVLHTDPHKPSLSLISNICYPDIHSFSNEATQWGCENEMEALKAYKARNGQVHDGLVLAKCGFHLSIEHPFLGASPDALVDCTCCCQGLVEVKCPLCCRETSFADTSKHMHSNFCLNNNSNGTFNLDQNHPYAYQCQLQLFVTEKHYCDFVVWSSSEIHIEWITLDKSLIQAAISVASKFWRLCVLPELLGKWYTRPQTGNGTSPCPHKEEDQGKWCYCQEEKGGEMNGCDSKSCDIKWFHLQCVGMTASSVPQRKRLCPTCHSLKYRRRKSSSFCRT